ncbi:MAG: hypothetical protein II453_16180 [Alphaproteobacteria bacterium]|nr:hypothetical protein [Alphaproteobacteria bacterium]
MGSHELKVSKGVPIPEKKFQFSKVIVAFVLICYFGIIVSAIVLMAIIQDLSALPYLVTTMGASVTFVVKYYCKKEGAFNIVRFKMQHKIPIKEDDFNFNQGVDNDDQLEGETF